MKKFTTNLGRTITAENLESAKDLAAKYNMGQITGPAVTVAAKKPSQIRKGNFAAWCDLRQAAIETGSLATASYAVYEDSELEVVFFGNGRPEKLNSAEKAAVRKFFREAE